MYIQCLRICKWNDLIPGRQQDFTRLQFLYEQVHLCETRGIVMESQMYDDLVVFYSLDIEDRDIGDALHKRKRVAPSE